MSYIKLSLTVLMFMLIFSNLYIKSTYLEEKRRNSNKNNSK